MDFRRLTIVVRWMFSARHSGRRYKSWRRFSRFHPTAFPLEWIGRQRNALALLPGMNLSPIRRDARQPQPSLCVLDGSG
ncbi:MAG: hypothetical protein ACRD9L_17295, partial [Bryobacteraceae bacterium]